MDTSEEGLAKQRAALEEQVRRAATRFILLRRPSVVHEVALSVPPHRTDPPNTQMRERRERVARWQAVRKLKARAEGGGGASSEGAGAAVGGEVADDETGGGAGDQDGWSSDEDEKLAQEGKSGPPLAPAVKLGQEGRATDQMSVHAAKRRRQQMDVASVSVTDASSGNGVTSMDVDGATIPESPASPDANGGGGAVDATNEEEVDPLDAYMAGVIQEVAKIKKFDQDRLAKKDADEAAAKAKSKLGELLTGNDDAVYVNHASFHLF